MQTRAIGPDLSMLSVRSLSSGAREIEGYASVWDRPDAYGDIVRRGAFSRTLEQRERPVRMRWQHYGPVIGRWLELREDDVGLYARGQLIPRHSVAEDVAAAIEAGAVDGLSIGFFATGYRELAGKLRELTEIDLVEISVVEEPAQVAATIHDIRALGGAGSVEELVRMGVRMGLGHREVMALVERAYELGRADGAAKVVLGRVLERLR